MSVAEITDIDAAEVMAERRNARIHLHNYICYTNVNYKRSKFSEMVCEALDQFVIDVMNEMRPILVLQAPPQHGKSEMVSRKLPAFLMGSFPSLRIGTASYAGDLANRMAQDVRRNLASVEHQKLFPGTGRRNKYDVDRMGEFNAPGGSGSYIAVGIGSGLTGMPVDIGIIDDPTKDAQEALSEVTKETHWNWYQSVFTSRLSKMSGQIIMATSWAQDDLPGRILELHRGSDRLKHLRFPAINSKSEVGYQANLPDGPLVSELHPIEQLLEFKALSSDYWWSALYQQSPKAMGGNVFKESGIQHWLPKDLPEKWDQVIASWDCTFKDTDGTDFVVGQVWGKKGARAFLLDQVRARMSFTATCEAMVVQKNKWPSIRNVLIEDKANGPAVIDFMKGILPGILAIEPDGSKQARAHAVTGYWEAMNVFLPHEALYPWVTQYIAELTAFPAAAHDDQVDSTTQALRHLFPLFGRLSISPEALARARGIS